MFTSARFGFSIIASVLFSLSASAVSTRIKDITVLEGARSNSLTGVGLVTGLQGTGGKSPATQQAAVNLLQRAQMNVKIFQQAPTDAIFKSKSIALVYVTATLGPFSRKGSKIDITVSVMDDASSLQGGYLTFTPLAGADGIVYATAEGPLALGGFSFGGKAAKVQKNFVAVGRVPGGAVVEKEARGKVVNCGAVRLLLNSPDHTTAKSISTAINKLFPFHSLALDAGAVHVTVPRRYRGRTVQFVSEIGSLKVTPDMAARVIINERTGTVVIGSKVTISPVALAHGNLSIVTRESPQVSQPAPFGQGNTAVVPRTDITAIEPQSRVNVLNDVTTVGELANALNALGVSPQDLSSIFDALQKSGALHGRLEQQ